MKFESNRKQEIYDTLRKNVSDFAKQLVESGCSYNVVIKRLNEMAFVNKFPSSYPGTLEQWRLLYGVVRDWWSKPTYAYYNKDCIIWKAVTPQKLKEWSDPYKKGESKYGFDENTVAEQLLWLYASALRMHASALGVLGEKFELPADEIEARDLGVFVNLSDLLFTQYNVTKSDIEEKFNDIDIWKPSKEETKLILMTPEEHEEARLDQIQKLTDEYEERLKDYEDREKAGLLKPNEKRPTDKKYLSAYKNTLLKSEAAFKGETYSSTRTSAPRKPRDPNAPAPAPREKSAKIEISKDYKNNNLGDFSYDSFDHKITYNNIPVPDFGEIQMVQPTEADMNELDKWNELPAKMQKRITKDMYGDTADVNEDGLTSDDADIENGEFTDSDITINDTPDGTLITALDDEGETVDIELGDIEQVTDVEDDTVGGNTDFDADDDIQNEPDNETEPTPEELAADEENVEHMSLDKDINNRADFDDPKDIENDVNSVDDFNPADDDIQNEPENAPEPENKPKKFGKGFGRKNKENAPAVAPVTEPESDNGFNPTVDEPTVSEPVAKPKRFGKGFGKKKNIDADNTPSDTIENTTVEPTADNSFNPVDEPVADKPKFGRFGKKKVASEINSSNTATSEPVQPQRTVPKGKPVSEMTLKEFRSKKSNEQISYDFDANTISLNSKGQIGTPFRIESNMDATTVTIFRNDFAKLLDLVYITKSKKTNKVSIKPVSNAISGTILEQYVDLLDEAGDNNGDDWMDKLYAARNYFENSLKSGYLFKNATIDDVVEWLQKGGEKECID